jgi:hypothetical protein
MAKLRNIPQNVLRRILRRAADGEKAIVLTLRHGVPSRVFGVDEYLQRRQLPKQLKPWKYRSRPAMPDPLGAADGTVLGSLSRSEIYE